MNQTNSPILISACLTGINCRYNGTNALREDLLKRYSYKNLIPVCPEQLGGLPTPRPQAEISSDKVIDINGRDATKEFIDGANEVLRIVKLFDIKKALLKEKSPSCGVRFIYKNNKLLEGIGVTARLLKTIGVEIEGVD
ncbi:MAG: DUF523 domain-containing protein [Deltaproteobacteria bacterium]|nr:DUF523 domain-containing protein [Deltaproteobacteria bacterium]